MDESSQVQAEAAPFTSTSPRRLFYAPWMIAILILFVICEVFFFAWGENAVFYATVGLFFAFIFNAFRCWRVREVRTSCLEIFIFLVVTFIFVCVILISVVVSCREAARRAACINNLQQLAISIHNYTDAQKKFPPPYITNEAGQPLLSWRIFPLPFIAMKSLHDRFDFQKPWDSPENKSLATSLSFNPFQCPSLRDPSNRSEYLTDYVAVTGDDTIWPTDGTKRTFKDITAGSANTAMLIEINNSDILWSEPRDIKLEDLLSGKVSWSKTAVHTSEGAFYYPNFGRHVVFCDASIRYFDGDLTPDQLRRLFSITEPFYEDTELSRSEQRPIVFRHVVFYVWLATLVMQLCYIGFPIEKRRKRV